MSSYRDDMNDTAVASSSTWMGLRTIAEGTARASSVILSALFVLHIGTATASDGVTDSAMHLLEDVATASDLAVGHAILRNRVTDGARANDAILGRVLHLLTDTAQASDSVMQGVLDTVRDGATIGSTVLHQRRAADLRTDKARVTDVILSVARVLVVDAAQAEDWVGGRARGSLLSVDAATVGDAVIDARQASAAVLADRAIASSELFGRLLSADVIADVALVDGQAVQFGDFGQAWTTNTGSWPMSRYAPFTFTSLAVIDGVVYATGAGGVFALDSQDEDIAALMRTGKLDLGKDTLVRLVEAPVEYELDGIAALDVTQTQSGTSPETYTYEPDERPTLELTNSRFQLGRGLKGRHFTFALTLQGRRGYINDLRVTVAPSKRSM